MDITNLSQALNVLQDEQEIEAFLKDILTPQEIKAVCERWEIACLLERDKLSYRDISAKTGASTTTVSRVARFLKNEPYQGYKLALGRIKQ